MDQSLCDKLNALPREDRIKFRDELNKVLNDRTYAIRQYGFTEEDYNNLSSQSIGKAQERLYQELFEGKEKTL
jgi:hypothetical protein